MKRQKVKISDELTIAGIQEKYDVSRTTAWRASKRGWLWQNYHGDQSAPLVKKGIVQKFERLVNQPAINVSQLTSLPEQKIWDIIKGASPLREDGWTKFKAEYVEIRNMMHKFVNAKGDKKAEIELQTICNDARIKKFLLFSNKLMLFRLYNNQSIYAEEITSAKKQVKYFLDRTQL